MPKLGRNQPCWCGSGRKYKKCHLNADLVARRGSKMVRNSRIDRRIVEEMLSRRNAEESRRQSLQGKGKPIISADYKGHRFVAVGNTLHYSKIETTKTFPDFLGNYIRSVLTPEWGNAEIAKPLKDRHPILQWYDGLCRIQKENYKGGEVFETPATGLVFAYTSLAYNLYLLAHNVEVQEHLVRRLKDRKSFYAALYETHVAAWFILAGFKLSLEDEADSARSHCEFAAEAPSGQRYSVEAKCRQPRKEHMAIGNQLYKALRKQANYPRIVCIEMNVPQEAIDDADAFVDAMVERARRLETSLTVDGAPAPPAYLFITNMPHHLHLDDECARRVLLADGFKIDDFGFKRFPSLAKAYKARLKHADALSVASTFQKYWIPSTFDGELPEFAFGDAERRFNIGEQHELDDGVVGVLRHGTVAEAEKKAWLIYETEDGRTPIYTAILSDAEVAAYKRHPETFFGRLEHVGKRSASTMDLYESFYEASKNASREKMLEWLARWPDLSELEKLPTEELRFVHAERMTIGVIHKNPPNDVEFPKETDQVAGKV